MVVSLKQFECIKAFLQYAVVCVPVEDHLSHMTDHKRVERNPKDNPKRSHNPLYSICTADVSISHSG